MISIRCHPKCDYHAEFAILGEGETDDMETHSCSEHLTYFLSDSGVYTVWSILDENS